MSYNEYERRSRQLPASPHVLIARCEDGVIDLAMKMVKDVMRTPGMGPDEYLKLLLALGGDTQKAVPFRWYAKAEGDALAVEAEHREDAHTLAQGVLDDMFGGRSKILSKVLSKTRDAFKQSTLQTSTAPKKGMRGKPSRQRHPADPPSDAATGVESKRCELCKGGFTSKRPASENPCSRNPGCQFACHISCLELHYAQMSVFHAGLPQCTNCSQVYEHMSLGSGVSATEFDDVILNPIDANERDSKRSPGQVERDDLARKLNYGPHITSFADMMTPAGLSDLQVYELQMLALIMADNRFVKMGGQVPAWEQSGNKIMQGPMGYPSYACELSGKTTNAEPVRTKSRLCREYHDTLGSGWIAQVLNLKNQWHWVAVFFDLDNLRRQEREMAEQEREMAESAVAASASSTTGKKKKKPTAKKNMKPTPEFFVVNTLVGTKQSSFDANQHGITLARAALPTPAGKNDPPDGDIKIHVMMGNPQQPDGYVCGLASSALGILVAAGLFDPTLDDYSSKDIRRCRLCYDELWSWYATVMVSVKRDPGQGYKMKLVKENVLKGHCGLLALPPYEVIPAPKLLPSERTRWHTIATTIRGSRQPNPDFDSSKDIATQDLSPALPVGKLEGTRMVRPFWKTYNLAGKSAPFPGRLATRPNATAAKLAVDCSAAAFVMGSSESEAE